MRTVVLLPTYNEMENLPRLIPEIFTTVKTDLIIIDDNSPDGTGDYADKLSIENPAVSVIRRPCKMGLGSAYIAGFKKALEKNYDAVIQMDSDFSHSPADLPRLLAALENCDVVIGSRYINGGGIEGWTFYRKWVSAIGNYYARGVLGNKVKDLTGGFKVFRRKVIESMDLNAVLSDGYAFQIETTFRALKKGFNVTEVPIVFRDRMFGCSKLSKKIIWEAFRIVWELKFQ